MSTVNESVSVKVVPDAGFWILVLIAFVVGGATGIAGVVYGQKAMLENVRLYTDISKEMCPDEVKGPPARDKKDAKPWGGAVGLGQE